MKSSTNNKRAYLYKQLSDTLRKEILEGVYKPDERLPSMDDLAEQYKMNRITVKRALSELRAEGLIYSIPAQGTYVALGEQHTVNTGKGRKTVALVISGLHTHSLGAYHVDVITGIQEALGDHEWYLMLVNLDDPSEDRAYEHVMQIQLDGAIYLGYFTPSLLRRLVRNGPPSVLIDQKIRGLKCDMINVDNYAGAFEAAQYLIEQGHRKIVCVTGSPGIVSDERKNGVEDAWKENGYPAGDLTWVEGDFQRESGLKAAEKLLKSKQHPTAIFCFNDEMAAGVLQTLHDRNIRVPGEISVIGFDNITWTLATWPQLTTVQVERFAMGRLAIERLADHLNNNDHTPTSIAVSTKLVVRDSTAAVSEK
ncbi:MAG: GntR family transcriptional regulator [Verrucomicrobia bacterium]|nr:GntR family transcriptional regulator [Verrucomicrobiota bacterium]MCH8526273.1 GntR family transcriptional regulator [Kiritimatiellia bacterium]